MATRWYWKTKRCAFVIGLIGTHRFVTSLPSDDVMISLAGCSHMDHAKYLWRAGGRTGLHYDLRRWLRHQSFNARWPNSHVTTDYPWGTLALVDIRVLCAVAVIPIYIYIYICMFMVLIDLFTEIRYIFNYTSLQSTTYVCILYMNRSTICLNSDFIKVW